MQPTLRQTPPSVRPAVDQHHLLAEVGGAECGGVAAGAGAEDEQVGLEVGRRGARAGVGAAAGAGAGLADGGAGMAAPRRPAGAADARVGRKQAALAHLVADLDVDLADDAVLRRRHVERRLVALEGEQRRLSTDGLSGRDEDLDDRHVLEVANVRKSDLLRHGLAPDRFQRMTRRMSSTTPARWRMKRAAAAPSMTR